MHHVNAGKNHRDKVRWELHNSTKSYFEQMLEATSHEQHLYGHLLPITKPIQVRRAIHAGHYSRSKGELISEVFLLSPTKKCASIVRVARTYLHQLSADTGCSLKDLPGTMEDRDGEKWGGIRTVCVNWWWWIYAKDIYIYIFMQMIYTYIYIYIYIYICKGYWIVWNEPPQALASMSMHIKRNIYVL